MTTRNPVFYDSTVNEHRPMDAGDTIPPQSIPLSAAPGNKLLINSDGLYYGADSGTVLYIDAQNGNDTNPGTKAAPKQTLGATWAAISALFPGSVYQGQGVTVAFRAGQTHVQNVDIGLPMSSQLTFAFYGDTKYGDFNSALVGGTAYPYVMADLQRPVIAPQITTTGAKSLNKMWGVNLSGGHLSLHGVQVNLPGLAVNPSITDVSGFADYVRATAGSGRSSVSLTGAVFNMTNTGTYWGALGCHPRAELSVHQFASQFQILGQPVVSGGTYPAATLAARQYFIKFYPDYAGSDQTEIFLSPTALQSSNGSGTIFVSWSDTEALAVGTSTSLASSPLSFDVGFGLIQYVYGVNKTSGGQLLNLISSRII